MTKDMVTMYTCPMHPEVIRDKSGMCKICGMALIPTKHEGHEIDKSAVAQGAMPDKHAGHDTAEFGKKFWISLVLTIPVVFYSELAQKFFGYTAPVFFGSLYLSFILSTIVFFYGGWIFIASARRELKAKLPGMMTLIALAISAAYLFSVYATIAKMGETLFWELTTLITIMLLGHWMEMRAVSGAQGALRELSKLLPDMAEVVIDGGTKQVSLAELKIGDIVLIRPGAKIPADGHVIEGKSEVNESMITGESKLVSKSEGAEVIAGTINSVGALKVKVTKIGKDTFLSGVMRLVEEAQASKSRLQILSDKAAYYLTLVAISSGVVTFIAWMITTLNPVFATERLVAVLVIACPHALGLAVPLVASISTTMAAQNGFLVRNRLALEMARTIDTVLFDKTGTLTKGEYGVDKIWAINGDEKQVLGLAASVDSQSEHPVSKAIVERAKNQGASLSLISNFERISGKGVKGTVGSKIVYVGGTRILEFSKTALDPKILQELEAENKKGKTIIYLIVDEVIAAIFGLADVIREESRQAIDDLKKMGVKVVMITGDSADVADWVSKDLGIDEYFAKVLPGEKAEKVKVLQSRNQKVAMVGDGINDAPALTQADLGIAIGAGTNVAIESAGIILVKNDPRDIVKIIKLSKLTYTKMIQNLFWATGYNVVALPLAAGVLASAGIILQPALAALFMSLSTVIVAINAVLLRRVKLS